MSQTPTKPRVTTQASFSVYSKAPGVNGVAEAGILDSAPDGDNGWEAADNLRVKEIRLAAWPKSGTASFDRIPADGVIDAFELGLFDYGPDDQVRVIMQPHSLADHTDPVVVFEGMLQRASFNVTNATDRRDESETVSFTAVDAPSIDNESPEHLIRGRFLASGDPVEPVLIDGLAMPCVFNAGSLPNMLDGSTVDAEAGDLTLVSCNLFTPDADHRATYWTLADALKHLIVCWLYGIDSAANGDAQGALKRSVTIDNDTYVALFTLGTPDADRWIDLQTVLPQVSVQGLGVFDAIDRVCRAAGYRSATLLPMGRDLGGTIDRQYQLRIWPEGAGPENTLKLLNRSTVSDSLTADQLLAGNNFVRLSGLRDTARLRNHIIVTGRLLIETTVQLKPLWKPADVDNLGGETISVWHQAMPVGQDGDTYHQKHDARGNQFASFGHVGRIWGIDSTGAFEANSLGYSTGPYAHPAGGFDWLTHLGIDGQDDLTAARTANHVTDPIRFATRTRRPLRLTRVESVQIDQSYRIDVSEDGGTTWYELPQSVASVLTGDYFGIRLNVKNLAAVNRHSFGEDGTGAAAEPAESWWALMTQSTPDLRFRLTCLIEADSAARYDAKNDAVYFSEVDRASRIDTGITEVWQSPSSVLGDETWARINNRGIVQSAAGVNRTSNLRDLAERVREDRGQVRFSIAAEHWLMDPTIFGVGDVITGVQGRNLDFDRFAPGAAEARHPSIIGMTIAAYPSQNISIDIGDEAARRGV